MILTEIQEQLKENKTVKFRRQLITTMRSNMIRNEIYVYKKRLDKNFDYFDLTIFHIKIKKTHIS